MLHHSFYWATLLLKQSMMKNQLLLVVALAATVARSEEVCPINVSFPIHEMIAGVNQMMENMLSNCENFTEASLGSNFEMRFSAFTGIIRPRNDILQNSSEISESQRVKRERLEELGYVNKNGSFYKFHLEGVDWWTANSTCNEEGAHLVVIDSDEEASLVADMFADITPTNTHDANAMFIGVTDLAEEGVFVTVLGDDILDSGYVNWWSDSNPDDWKVVNPAGEDCVTMDRNTLMNDLHCDAKLAFACEAELS